MTKALHLADQAHVPLVLHVIPTPVARGAQREARAIADQLDVPGVRQHRVLNLFDGPEEVATDFSLHLRSPRRSTLGFDPRHILKIRRELRRLGPAVVVSHGSDPLKYLVAAMVRNRRPLVYYAIGTYAGSPDRRLQLRLWRLLAARADVVAACGRDVALECSTLLGVPADRIALTWNGRDARIFHPRPNGVGNPQPVITFIGALTSGKRPDMFIQVVKLLRDRKLTFRAQIIGDGPLAAQLVGPARHAGVELLGARSDVAELLRSADLLVFPSLPAGEGLPGVLIEAGMSGLPVVATAAPGVSTVVEAGQTGLVVGVDDLEAMVNAVGDLLAAPSVGVEMGRAARKRCEELFSLPVVASRWLEILQPLLPNPETLRT